MVTIKYIIKQKNSIYSCYHNFWKIYCWMSLLQHLVKPIQVEIEEYNDNRNNELKKRVKRIEII